MKKESIYYYEQAHQQEITEREITYIICASKIHLSAT